MSRRTAWAGLCLGAAVIGAAGGCQKGGGQPPPPSRPVVPVSRPVQRPVTESVEYTGRTDAVESVGIKARVTGYLTRVNFREGGEVRAGDLLVEVDPRPYKAQLDQPVSQVEVNKAQL